MIVPIRDLGRLGVNTDIDPFDLPINSFTAGNNVRFVDNRITRGPVFSVVGTQTSNNAPRWAYSYRLQGQSAVYLVMQENGKVASLSAVVPGSSLTYSPKSPGAYVESTQPYPFTVAMLANTVYVNRQDRVPWGMRPGDTSFQPMSSYGWDATWLCQSLRSYNGCLVAMNVTKGATVYPTMIKTSDFAPFASFPGTWSAALDNSATENVLTELNEPIIDGWPLRDRFIIYSSNQTWFMSPSGDANIYNYERLFGNYGVINVNCVAEVNNSHYVFGDNDLWMHDGYQPRSIANGRVRRAIFENMVVDEKRQFFVWSNPKLQEIMFCYVSRDPYCAFPVNEALGYSGCNKACVYNWHYDTFYFYDLPYVVGGGLGQMYTGLIYDDLNSTTYSSSSGTYEGIASVSQLFNIALARGGSIDQQYLPLQTTGSWNTGAMHLLAFESLDNNVGIGEASDVLNAPVFLENRMMDMDEIAQEARAYKIVTSIYPEGRLQFSDNPMSFWTGSVDYSGQSVSYGDPMTFDGDSLYKLDFNSPGRYLSMRMAIGNPVQKFSLSGFDLDFKLFGHR